MPPNVLVETLQSSTGAASRENTNWSGPGVEAFNSRIETLGAFRQVNPAASQANTAMTLGGVDAEAPTSQPAPLAGNIVGVVARANVAVSAGQATFRPIKNGVVQGTGVAADSALLTSTAQTKVTMLDPSAYIPFVAGDLLGVGLATNGAYAPATDDHSAFLLVRWNA